MKRAILILTFLLKISLISIWLPKNTSPILPNRRLKPRGGKSFYRKYACFLLVCRFFKDVRMTDDEINTVLARSARSVRRGMFDRRSRVETDGNGPETDEVRFSVGGKYFKKWQDVIEQFKKDLEGVELNQEQRDIYDVVLRQKDKIRLRINDLNELEDIFVNSGTRKKAYKNLYLCIMPVFAIR